MNSKTLTEKLPAPLHRRPLFVGALVGLILLVLAVLLLRPSKAGGVATAYHEVRRGDFTVSVVEGGNLAAVSEVSIRSEVEGTARIVHIVPEGTYVKKGDLLVELDSAQAQDQVNQQQINFEKAKFAVEQAIAQLEIQKSATNSDFLAAQLKLQFAEIDLQKYMQGQRAVDLIEASNKVLQAQAQLKVNADNYSNSIKLNDKGYETKQKLEGDFLSWLNSRNAVTVATNSQWLLEKFDLNKQQKQYVADVEQADQELKRVVNQNRRKMAQYEADLLTQSNTLALSEQKLKRDMKNLAATKVYAPQDGLVVYQVGNSPFSSESLVEGGAVVRNRQELIKLPDLSRMKVVVKVHESHINLVQPGLPALVMLDSMPDQRFQGVVERVAPLPDTTSRWGNPNLKVYNTEIYITDTLPNVKPGVSAKVEIIVTNISDALSVPVQSVTSYKGKPVVYLANGSKSEPRPVEVGMFNTKFIEVRQGIKPGDRVLLSPPFDTQEKDLEGAVLAASEKAEFAKTNKPAPRPQAPTTPAGETPGFAPGAGEPVAAMAPPAGGNAEMAQGQGQRRAGGNFNREELVKQFDKNGDGELDETERDAMRQAMAARFGAMGGPGRGGTNAANRGPRMNREEMMKRFDKNGDGELDEDERTAMRASFGAPPGGSQPSQERGSGRRTGAESQDRESGTSPARENGTSKTEPVTSVERAPEPTGNR